MLQPYLTDLWVEGGIRERLPLTFAAPKGRPGDGRAFGPFVACIARRLSAVKAWRLAPTRAMLKMGMFQRVCLTVSPLEERAALFQGLGPGAGCQPTRASETAPPQSCRPTGSHPSSFRPGL